MTNHQESTPPSPQTNFKAWNEEMARKYSPGRFHEQSHPVIRWIERQRVQAIISFLAASDDTCVLEVGCGAGNVLAALPNKVPLLGIDLSTNMVTEANRRLSERKHLIIQANAERLPFKTGSIKRVICTEVVEHVLHPEAVFAEIARVAVPEARIVISIPNEKLINTLRRIIGGLRFLWRTGGGDEWHLHAFDMQYLQQKAHTSLEILQVKAIVSSLLPLRYVVLCRRKNF